MVERASALAVEAGDVPARNLADSYRAFHLAMVGRYDEAVAQAEDVIGRAPSLTDYGYDTMVSIVALTACCAVHDPARGRGMGRPHAHPSLLGRPGMGRPGAGGGGPRLRRRGRRGVGTRRDGAGTRPRTSRGPVRAP